MNLNRIFPKYRVWRDSSDYRPYHAQKRFFLFFWEYIGEWEHTITDVEAYIARRMVQEKQKGVVKYVS